MLFCMAYPIAITNYWTGAKKIYYLNREQDGRLVILFVERISYFERRRDPRCAAVGVILAPWSTHPHLFTKPTTLSP